MDKKFLGKGGLEVSAIGLSCMRIGKDYGETCRNEAINIIAYCNDG